MFKPIANTRFIGKSLTYLPTCHSTNDCAHQLLRVGQVNDGTIIITSEQTNGRGQRGNQWITQPNKNLTFSIILDISTLDPKEIFYLNMAVSVGVLHSLQRINSKFSGGYKVKWPNDYYYNDHKIGGMLIETQIKPDRSFWAVVGIGINVNQVDFGRLNATSLTNINEGLFDLNELVSDISLSIEKQLEILKMRDYNNLKADYTGNLYRFGMVSNFKSEKSGPFEGKIVDIDDSGKIGIETDNRILYFDKQQIRFLLIH